MLERRVRPWAGVKDQDSEAVLFSSPLYGLEIGTETGSTEGHD